MSKAYRVNMSIDVSKATPKGGFILKSLGKDADPKEEPVRRTGPEVFAFLCGAAINGANAKCGFQALKGFRKIIRSLELAVAKAEWIANKSDINTLIHSINGNQNWPNANEIFDVLEAIMDNLEKAELITENPSQQSAAK